MTSSSDREPWMPLSLTRVELAPGAGVVAEPEPAAPAAVAVEAGRGWLPALADDGDRARALLEDEAYRRGRADASREERARADERCRTALQAVARAAAHLESISAEFARDRERDLQTVALAVARKLVRREIEASPELLGSLVTRAIELLPLDHALDVRLHPDDLRTLGANTESLLPAGRSVRVQWIADPAVDKGGFLVESPARIVDGRTDIALRALYERFDHE